MTISDKILVLIKIVNNALCSMIIYLNLTIEAILWIVWDDSKHPSREGIHFIYTCLFTNTVCIIRCMRVCVCVRACVRACVHVVCVVCICVYM